MKRISAIALALSLLALSWGPAIPQAAALSINAARAAKAPAAPVTGLPTLPATLGAGLSAASLAPGLKTPGLSALPRLVPAAAPAARPAAAPGSLTAAIYQTPEGRPTPFAQSMSALSAAAPEFKDMSVGQSRAEAANDFQARIGQPETPVAALGDVTAHEAELLISAPAGSGKQVTEDVYPQSLGAPGLSVRQIDLAMRTQLQKLGIDPQLLSDHNARAIGAISQINTAVVKVSAADVGLLQSLLESQGLKVQIGRTFSIPKPLTAEPSARAVGLKEMAKIIGADKLQAELTKVLGEPTPPSGEQKTSLLSRIASWSGKAFRSALGLAVENPILPWAVLDSWAAVNHPFLKGRFIKSVANEDDGEAHGTHTSGTVVGMDRWNFHGRNYNIFPGGSASEGDILFKLNMAQQDGALATTNSWGDGSGNPEGAIEKLFVKTAQAGMHHSISAGNSGSSPNTIGGPAIATYTTDVVVNGQTIGKVKRIKAIAASDADKKTAYFSSRGPGSMTTSRNPGKYKDYPQKPDEAGVGVNLVAPVPVGPKVDELGGPGRSMSGTSMSNPGVFGGFMLLTRSILVLLKDYLPAAPSAAQIQFVMDLARFAMTQTAEKTAGPSEVGDGFVNVWSAFEYAAKTLKDNAPRKALPRARALLRGMLGFAN